MASISPFQDYLIVPNTLYSSQYSTIFQKFPPYFQQVNIKFSKKKQEKKNQLQSQLYHQQRSSCIETHQELRIS